MWYFTWVLGVGFAVLLAVMNAMWGETEAGRGAARVRARVAERLGCGFDSGASCLGLNDIQSEEVQCSRV